MGVAVHSTTKTTKYSRMLPPLAVLAEPLLPRQCLLVHVETHRVKAALAGAIASHHVRHARRVQLPARRANPVILTGRRTPAISSERRAVKTCFLGREGVSTLVDWRVCV